MFRNFNFNSHALRVNRLNNPEFTDEEKSVAEMNFTNALLVLQVASENLRCVHSTEEHNRISAFELSETRMQRRSRQARDILYGRPPLRAVPAPVFDTDEDDSGDESSDHEEDANDPEYVPNHQPPALVRPRPFLRRRPIDLTNSSDEEDENDDEAQRQQEEDQLQLESNQQYFDSNQENPM